MKLYLLRFYCFIFFSCSMIVAQGQSLKEELAACYEYIINNKNITVSVEVAAWEKGIPDNILDNQKLTYICDDNGYYSFVDDIESIQGKEFTVRIDNMNNEVVIANTPTFDASKSNNDLLASYLLPINLIDSVYTIEKNSENGKQIFSLSLDDQEKIRIAIKNNQLEELLMYPDELVDYKGREIETVLKMKYQFSTAKKRKQIKDVFSKIGATPILRNKYADFNLLDLRSINQ